MTDVGGIRPAPLIDESMTSKSSKFYRSGVAKKITSSHALFVEINRNTNPRPLIFMQQGD